MHGSLPAKSPTASAPIMRPQDRRLSLRLQARACAVSGGVINAPAAGELRAASYHSGPRLRCSGPPGDTPVAKDVNKIARVLDIVSGDCS